MAALRHYTLFIAVAVAVTAEESSMEEVRALAEKQAKQIESLLSKQASLEQRLMDTEAILNVTPYVEQSNSRRLQSLTQAFQDDVTASLDYIWHIVCGALVMFMQAGFAMLEAGSVRSKSAGAVLMKNLLDVCIGTMMWYFVGYAFAYGGRDSNPSDFGGAKYFAGSAGMITKDSQGALTDAAGARDWFFQWAFCATSATIVSGGVAERIQVPIYLVYSGIMTGIIYPIVVYWTWSGNGWLTELTYLDFAGSGIVHLTGGIAALVGALVCGPRKGRFENPDAFNPHSVALMVIGTFILWFGWYGFNCGSTLGLSTASSANTAALVAMNSTMSAAAGGLMVFVLRLIKEAVMQKKAVFDVAGLCNGILAGLVAICCGADAVLPGVAVLIGIVGGMFYEIGHNVLLLLRVDDPLDAFSVHGMGGIAGLLLTPLVKMSGADGKMFGAHVCGICAIMAWSGGLTFMFLFPLRLLKVLNYSDDDQDEGGDKHISPNKAYSMSESDAKTSV